MFITPCTNFTCLYPVGSIFLENPNTQLLHAVLTYWFTWSWFTWTWGCSQAMGSLAFMNLLLELLPFLEEVFVWLGQKMPASINIEG